MRISFDLDDTLICGPDVPSEPPLPFPIRVLIQAEPLRAGSVELMCTLQSRGWDIWIYTTSPRARWWIRLWLWCNGIHLDGIINAATKRIAEYPPHIRRPSKDPRVYSIDLHVDDSEGVVLEGEHFGFRVCHVRTDDRDWTERVLDAAARLE